MQEGRPCEDTAVYKPASDTLPEANFDTTLILNFGFQYCEKIKSIV